MFLTTENSKNTIQFSDNISVWTANKSFKHSFGLVFNQTESYSHRFIKSVSYKQEMSEKIFWIQKIKKNTIQFSDSQSISIAE